MSDNLGKTFSEIENLEDNSRNRSELKNLSEFLTPEMCDPEKKYSNIPIEGHGGHWEDEPGNSKWIPDYEFVPQKFNPSNQTMGEIMDKYKIDHISFKGGYPVFSEISKGIAKISNFSDSRPDNFMQADIKLAEQYNCSPNDIKKWRQNNSYTWHECEDMKTMLLVPSEIHGNIPHKGGVSIIKTKNAEV